MIVMADEKKPKPIMGLNGKKQVFADRRTKRERDRSTQTRQAIQRSFRGE